MKRQVNIQDLVLELKKENLQKRDIILPINNLSMVDGKIVVSNPKANPELSKILYETGISQSGDSGQTLVLDRLDTIDTHLIDKLGIPTKYFEKLDSPEHLKLFDQNVSYWFKNNSGNILLRTFCDREESRGIARAMLSDRYRMIDNYDILLATLDAVNKVKTETGVDIQLDDKGCDLSDKRLVLRFIAPQIEIESPRLLKHYRVPGRNTGVGNTIISGFQVSNSETGHGQFSISARVKILKCDNGMIITNESYKQRHLGAKMDELQVWSEESRQKNLELVISQLKDSVREYVSADCLGRVINHLEEKAGYEVQHPADCVKQVTQSLGMSEEKGDEILSLFIKCGDPSAFGVAQALTLYSHTQGDADLQYDIERQAMGVLENIKEFDKPLVRKTTKVAANLN